MAVILFALISLLLIFFIVKSPVDFILSVFDISPVTDKLPAISSFPLLITPTVFKTPVLFINVVSKEAEVILESTFKVFDSIFEVETKLFLNSTSPFKIVLFSTVKFLTFKSSNERDTPVKSIPF